MRLAEILSVERISVGLEVADKASALRSLAHLLNPAGANIEEVYRVFSEREALASTGVGSGVAIPHGRLAQVERLSAAVGLCPSGVDFDAIDGQPVQILVAVLGPDRQAGEHLKALARFSRVLRDRRIRQELLAAPDASTAFALLVRGDG